MDREYIIKHNLMEAHKQFMRLSEGYFSTDLSEEGEDNPQDEPQGQEMPPTDPNQAPMDNNTPDAINGTPEPNMEQPGQEDMPPAPEGEMPPMDEPPMPDTDLEPEEDDEDVLDVEDLTQAQEKLNKKQNELGHDLGDVDGRIAALLTAVEKIQGSLEKNNNDITDLKAELEKRMPTKTEKLNMQSLKMYPFNVSPKEYWKDKEKDGVYQAEYDSEEPEVKKQYNITQDDVDNYSDRDIENSFDDELHQTMEKIFKGF